MRKVLSKVQNQAAHYKIMEVNASSDTLRRYLTYIGSPRSKFPSVRTITVEFVKTRVRVGVVEN